MNKKISYEASIKTTKNQINSDMKIKKEGIQLLNDYMNTINSALIQKFDEEYTSAKKINRDTALKCAQKAVNKAFPAELRQLAVAEGQRQLMLYKQGKLDYDFEKSLKEIKSSQQSLKKTKPLTVKPMLTKFTTAVGKVNEVFSSSDVRLDSKAKKLLGTYLYKLTAKIAKRASETVPENSILEYNHIMEILPEFLSSTILEMAHSEGSRNLSLHVAGVDEFRPRKITSLSSDILNDPILKDDDGDTSHDFLLSLEPSVLKSGIKKLQLDDSMKFDPSLALNVSQIANCLVSEVKSQTEQENLQEVDFMHLARAAQGIFPQNLLDHAALRARTLVEGYIKGAFTYKKRKAHAASKASPSKKRKIGTTSAAIKKRAKRKSGSAKKGAAGKKRQRSETKSGPSKKAPKKEAPKKAKKLDFSKEILDIFVNTYAVKDTPSASINRSGVEKLNSCIVDVLKLIVKECESETTISAETVRKSVEKYFPGEIGRHAKGAGARMIMIAKISDKNEKQKNGKQAPSTSKSKERARDTEGGTNGKRKESPRESSDENGDTETDTEVDAAESEAEEDMESEAEAEAEGDENEPDDEDEDDSPTIKEEPRSQESTPTVPTAGEPDDDTE